MSARTELGDHVDLPDWLVSVVASEMRHDIEGILDTIHTDDRLTLVDIYSRSLSAPGEAVSDSVRSSLFGASAVIEFTMVNLLAQPDVEAIIVKAEPLGAAPDDDVREEHQSDQQPANWMILTVDRSAVIRTVEGNSQAFLGYEHDELIGRAPAQFTATASLYAGIQMWRQLRDQPGATFTSRRQWVRKDGTSVWAETSYVTRLDPTPGEGSILLVVWDITDKVEAEAALRDREDQLRRLADDFQTLADEVSAAVFRCAADGSVTFHNAAWRRLLDERFGVARLHDLLAESARAQLDDVLLEFSSSGATDRRELELAGDDGTVWALSLRPVRDNGEIAFIGSLEDVTDTARLRVAASQDSLTGLLNRAAIEAALEESLRRRPTRTVVLFFDVDHFKSVNDTWGHEAGDAVLVELSERLRATVRVSDVAGRWGGDEFVAILDLDEDADVDEFADRLRRGIVGPVNVDDQTWHLSVAVGVARARPGDDVDGLLRRADLDMFRHKRADR